MAYIGNSPAQNNAVDTAQLASPLSGDLTVAGTLGTTGDTAAGDDAAVGYTSTEGVIITGQGSTDDVTIKNDADATVLQVATGTTNVELTAGNLIIGTHGKGIDFSANTDDAGGMTSELLDDYEEGTWTPVVADDDSNAAGHDLQGGDYTKIGRSVTLTGRVATSDLGVGINGDIRIRGLPFTQVDSGTNGSRSQVACSYATGFAISAGHNPCGFIELDQAYINLYIWDVTTGTSRLHHTEWTDDGALMFSCVYNADY